MPAKYIYIYILMLYLYRFLLCECKVICQIFTPLLNIYIWQIPNKKINLYKFVSSLKRKSYSTKIKKLKRLLFSDVNSLQITYWDKRIIQLITVRIQIKRKILKNLKCINCEWKRPQCRTLRNTRSQHNGTRSVSIN